MGTRLDLLNSKVVRENKHVRNNQGDFPGGPVVRAPSFHCRGPRFDPWLGNEDPTRLAARPKKKKKGRKRKKETGNF